MKIVVLLGYLLGIALPVLETMRRGFSHLQVNATTMFDDYIMGAVLLSSLHQLVIGQEERKNTTCHRMGLCIGRDERRLLGTLRGASKRCGHL